MKAYIALTVTSLSFSALASSHALAQPLTKANIEGKKICFGKLWNSFSPGGKVTNNVAGQGTWSISKAGVIAVRFPSGPYSGVFRDLGGGASEYSGSWIGTPTLTVAGALCN